MCTYRWPALRSPMVSLQLLTLQHICCTARDWLRRPLAHPPPHAPPEDNHAGIRMKRTEEQYSFTHGNLGPD